MAESFAQDEARQNDFASDDGALPGAVQHVMKSTGMQENTSRLLAAARRRSDDRARADLLRPGYRELALHPYGILKARTRSGSTTPCSPM